MTIQYVTPKLSGMYPIEDIRDVYAQRQLTEDGYGYCLSSIDGSFVRVEVVPDSEFYVKVRPATSDEAREWYKSFGHLAAYQDLARLLEEL